MSNQKERLMLVHVECVNGPDAEEDIGIEGIYEVYVDSEVTENKAASIALDVFHSSIAVEFLDDFDFYVTDEKGKYISEDDTHCSYSGIDQGRIG